MALSRCRSLEGIRLLSTIAERDIYVHPAVLRFSHNFNSSRIIDDALAQARTDAAIAAASQAFATGDMSRAVDCMAMAAEARPALLRSPAVRRLISRRLNIISRLESEAEALRLELSEAKERFRGLADEYVTLGWQCMADGNDVESLRIGHASYVYVGECRKRAPVAVVVVCCLPKALLGVVIVTSGGKQPSFGKQGFRMAGTYA